MPKKTRKYTKKNSKPFILKISGDDIKVDVKLTNGGGSDLGRALSDALHQFAEQHAHSGEPAKAEPAGEGFAGMTPEQQAEAIEFFDDAIKTAPDDVLNALFVKMTEEQTRRTGGATASAAS